MKSRSKGTQSAMQTHIKNKRLDRLAAIRFFWRQGFNTFEISKRTDMSEAQVWNLLDDAKPLVKGASQ